MSRRRIGGEGRRAPPRDQYDAIAGKVSRWRLAREGGRGKQGRSQRKQQPPAGSR
jgi:hypothetical protein